MDPSSPAPRVLPARPSLASLRKQAKQLLRQALASEAEALGRIRQSHPHPPAVPALRDAQLVLAREYGFDSWAKLREHLEHNLPPATDLSAQADRFVDLACLRYTAPDSAGRRRQAQQLFEQNPRLGEAGLHAAAALGDLASARRLLDADATLAGKRGGPRGWEPLLYLCYSRFAPDRPGFDPLAVAKLLLERGADPNSYVMLGPCRFTAITGAMGEGEGGPINQPPHRHSRALVELLLDAGADPNDGQGLYNTHFDPNNHWVELLLARGLSARQVLNWGDSGESTLDYLLGQAVCQGFLERVRLLLAHGAAAQGRDFYEKRTHHENAVLNGHPEIAELLAAHGATAVALAPKEQLRVASLRGDEREARRLLTAHPELLSDPDLLIAVADRGHAEAVRLLLDLGFAIDRRDEDAGTALHAAARSGNLATVRELVERGASLDLREDNYGATPVGFADHFAEYHPAPGRLEVRQYLVDRVTSVEELVYYGQIDRLAALLARDPAQARARGPRARTPLHFLNDEAGPTAPIVEILLQHGAVIDAVDAQGRTPLDSAIEAENEEAATALRGRGAVQSPERVSSEVANLLRGAYDAFNRRDVDSGIFAMHPEVSWPDGLEGRPLRGHEEVRASWTGQWKLADPSLHPQRFHTDDQGRIVVDVQQVVRSLNGELLVDQPVRHIYQIEAGLIRSMEVNNVSTNDDDRP